MFKVHKYYGTQRYFIIPPTGYLANRTPHSIEASLMGLSFEDYYKYIKNTFRSARLTVYPTFISYSLNYSDADKHMKNLNKLFKKVK